jgi:uncharacterized protein
MWDDITSGSVGAIVLVDTRRVHDAFPAIDFFEDRGVPFVVAVNVFDGAPHHSEARLRSALALAPDVPLVSCDARRGDTVIAVLISLVEHALARAHARA